VASCPHRKLKRMPLSHIGQAVIDVHPQNLLRYVVGVGLTRHGMTESRCGTSGTEA